MIVIGIDPGMEGALARFDSERNELDIVDMPIWRQSIGKTVRNRIDEVGIRDYFEVGKLFGIDLVVLEAVGGRPKQSASGAFVFGDGVGVLRATITCNRIAWEATPPSVWKRLMRVPVDKPGIRQAFLQRFPQYGHLIEGSLVTNGPLKGQRAIKDGRAEAAMLAMFGATHMQGKKPGADPVGKLVYDKARARS